MDDFLPRSLVEIAHDELRAVPQWWCDTEYPGNQMHKHYIPSAERDELTHSLWYLADRAPTVWALLNHLNGPGTLAWLQTVTGIGPLHADPSWLGAGVHRVSTGGLLDVHADFNVNWHTGMYRRLNLLIYLNPDWQTSWGGDLEIWDQSLSRCCHSIAPVMNRAVLMRIRDDAYHGHPRPLASPPDRPRYSLALYYYTTDRPDQEKAPNHGVVWQNKVG